MLSGCQTHVNPKHSSFNNIAVINVLRNILINKLYIVHATQNNVLIY